MSATTRAERRAARLDDPRFEHLRGPVARRRLVAGLVGILAAEAAVFAAIDIAPVAAVIAVGVLLVAFVFCLGALKAATRGVEELPPEVLDEREQQLRGVVYAMAYKIGSALLILWLVAGAGWAMVADGPPPSGILTAALLLPLHVVLVLPTLVAGWLRQL